ncbi:MAG: FAD-dependent thymidylate synthase [Candidatus Caldatribacteriota bacterium]|jgi:thymidylate synthase (FAD)|nr:FAD-dependent thymidylate synthase [Atribacterota bacterium]MDD3640671.1 FAD-dependent thymidylate synthase [Atribacterota bacterium]MDD4765008.1 FAD-dependent thymidylate synthase [Atribacterota bacterium]MDD5635299.1 FAD-dependent thymidylate synthase [Atribacterota bacterium]MDI9595974.1 FAD-dependent thymidylate synthase [Atribacterota bacterium]
MRVQIINYSKNIEKMVAQAARLCYSSRNINEIAESMDKNMQDRMIKKIMKLGHYSVLEHVSFTFGIEDISRTCSHQLVRHRIASFSQRSQRYVKFGSGDEKQFVIPHNIKNDNNLLQKFKDLTAKSFELYQEMIEKDIPAEDARYILPQAIGTSIIFTANARELIHFFRLRCCNRAQWEIRELAIAMLELVRKEAPLIFKDAGPPCLIGPCPEGEMSCGKPWHREN